MLVNLIGLLTDFFNDSRQNESYSTQYFDPFFENEYYLLENHFEIALWEQFELPTRVGRLRMSYISNMYNEVIDREIPIG